MLCLNAFLAIVHGLFLNLLVKINKCTYNLLIGLICIAGYEYCQNSSLILAFHVWTRYTFILVNWLKYKFAVFGCFSQLTNDCFFQISEVSVMPSIELSHMDDLRATVPFVLKSFKLRRTIFELNYTYLSIKSEKMNSNQTMLHSPCFKSCFACPRCIFPSW